MMRHKRGLTLAAAAVGGVRLLQCMGLDRGGKHSGPPLLGAHTHTHIHTIERQSRGRVGDVVFHNGATVNTTRPVRDRRHAGLHENLPFANKHSRSHPFLPCGRHLCWVT